MAGTVVAVIPTYNERENIAKLIEEINKFDFPVDILVVDDNSPDGTGEVVDSLKKTKSNLGVIHRKKKEGLGPAYVEAFQYLLNKGKHDYIVQMDADFSHNPKDIPRLLEKAEGCGAVVGSRYIKGGGISDRWSILRKFISRGGNIYAKLITGLNVNDCTAGFKCYKKEALQSIDFDRIFLNGYGFQVQMLYEINRNGLKICEVPIFFEERIAGSSKMNLSIMFEAFLSLIIMRIRDIFKKK